MTISTSIEPHIIINVLIVKMLNMCLLTEITKSRTCKHCFERFVPMKRDYFNGNVKLIRDVCRGLWYCLQRNLCWICLACNQTWLGAPVDAESPETLKKWVSASTWAIQSEHKKLVGLMQNHLKLWTKEKAGLRFNRTRAIASTIEKNPDKKELYGGQSSMKMYGKSPTQCRLD